MQHHLTYDANGNVTQRRLRDAQVIGLAYDNLGRLVAKDLPGGEPDATYAYDLIGRLTAAVQGGQTLGFAYDALSRNVSASGPLGSNAYAYDGAGRRTSLTYPGSGLVITYDYDTVGNVTAIRENGATFGVGVLATYAYDDLGRRVSLTRGNGVVTSYAFDPVSRLSALTLNPAGTAQDATLSFAYNPASQIASTTRVGDAYAWGQHYNRDTGESVNGLNQVTAQGANSVTHDARGNLTAALGKSWAPPKTTRI